MRVTKKIICWLNKTVTRKIDQSVNSKNNKNPGIKNRKREG